MRQHLGPKAPLGLAALVCEGGDVGRGDEQVRIAAAVPHALRLRDQRSGPLGDLLVELARGQRSIPLGAIPLGRTPAFASPSRRGGSGSGGGGGGGGGQFPLAIVDHRESDVVALTVFAVAAPASLVVAVAVAVASAPISVVGRRRRHCDAKGRGPLSRRGASAAGLARLGAAGTVAFVAASELIGAIGPVALPFARFGCGGCGGDDDRRDPRRGRRSSPPDDRSGRRAARRRRRRRKRRRRRIRRRRSEGRCRQPSGRSNDARPHRVVE